jgi:tetratricopeptide (TPR) repeat protein
MKRLFQRFVKGNRSSVASGNARLALGAFGKHPGWDDHIPGIGVETETLAAIKQRLYVGGIGSQIDSGAWEKLEPEKRLAGFNHTFLGFRGGHIIFGQLWSSVDRKGRSKYPMVLCLDGEGISAGFILRELAPGLERLRETCKAATTAEQVVAACREAQENLRRVLSGASSAAATFPTSDQKQRFLEDPALGPDHLGLLRVLHDLRSALQGTTGQSSRSRHFRVPTTNVPRGDALLLWAAFLQSGIPATTPLFLISPQSADWVEVIVGEPADADFFCLQASLKALPLATEIPYDLGKESGAHFEQVRGRFLSDQTSRYNKSSGFSAVAQPASDGTVKKGGFKVWILGIAILVVAAIALGWFVLFKNKSATVEATSVNSNAPAPFSAGGGRTNGTEGAVVARPPSNDAPVAPVTVGVDQVQKFEAAMNAASAALASRDFEKAAKQAEEALKLKPDDTNAAALASRAQQGLAFASAAAERHQNYTAASSAAASALNRGDFNEAIHQAQAALVIKPNDPASTQLIAKARSGIEDAATLADRNKKYAVATNAGFVAMAAGNYKEASNQAVIALTLKSNDPAALKLMADVKQNLESLAAAERRKQFEAAIKAGRDALQAGKNDEAIREAELALNLNPGDTTAAHLRDQGAEARDLAAAKSYFEQGQYDNAVKLCAAHPATSSFVELNNSATSEQQSLNDARQKLSAGDYSIIQSLENQTYGRKAPFMQVHDQASAEQSTLNDLQAKKQSNDWQTVRTKLTSEGSAVFAGKRPFQELKDWADGQYSASLHNQSVVILDAELEKYLVWFNVLKPSDPRIKTPDARKASRIDGEIGIQREQYLAELTRMENEYRKGGWLGREDRQKYLDELKDTVKHHD